MAGRASHPRPGSGAALPHRVSTWESHAASFEKLLDAGDDRVFAIIRQRFRGRGSGADVEMYWAQIYTLREGMILRIQIYSDRVEALEAVGLEE